VGHPRRQGVVAQVGYKRGTTYRWQPLTIQPYNRMYGGGWGAITPVELSAEIIAGTLYTMYMGEQNAQSVLNKRHISQATLKSFGDWINRYVLNEGHTTSTTPQPQPTPQHQPQPNRAKTFEVLAEEHGLFVLQEKISGLKERISALIEKRNSDIKQARNRLASQSTINGEIRTIERKSNTAINNLVNEINILIVQYNQKLSIIKTIMGSSA